MPCLSVGELPVDEQAELELHYAERLVEKIEAILRAHDAQAAARSKRRGADGRAGEPPCLET